MAVPIDERYDYDPLNHGRTCIVPGCNNEVTQRKMYGPEPTEGELRYDLCTWHRRWDRQPLICVCDIPQPLPNRMCGRCKRLVDLP
jgi:hypothetical protein